MAGFYPLVPKLHLGMSAVCEAGLRCRWCGCKQKEVQLPGQVRSQVQLGNERRPERRCAGLNRPEERCTSDDRRGRVLSAWKFCEMGKADDGGRNIRWSLPMGRDCLRTARCPSPLRRRVLVGACAGGDPDRIAPARQSDLSLRDAVVRAQRLGIKLSVRPRGEIRRGDPRPLLPEVLLSPGTGAVLHLRVGGSCAWCRRRSTARSWRSLRR